MTGDDKVNLLYTRAPIVHIILAQAEKDKLWKINNINWKKKSSYLHEARLLAPHYREKKKKRGPLLLSMMFTDVMISQPKKMPWSSPIEKYFHECNKMLIYTVGITK